MKNYVTSTVVASLVSIICILGLQFALKSQDAINPSSGGEDLASVIKAHSDSIAVLKRELRDFQERFDQKGMHKEDQVTEIARTPKIENLIDRIEVMEEALHRFSVDESKSGKAQSDKVSKQVAETMGQTSTGSTSKQTDVFEANFEEDSGVPLGDYAESIGETISAVEGLQVTGMDCRDTACRVTYSKTELFDPQGESDPSSGLVDELVQASNGREVEVRYAKDPSGDEVMYIQLR